MKTHRSNGFKIGLSISAIALSLAFSGATLAADAMSRNEYKAAGDQISAKQKDERAQCSSLAGNAKDICVAQAKGNEKVARAELEERYKPSAKHGQAVKTARADAEYAVAKERCDDQDGNAKDVCRKEARAAHTAAMADAKAAKMAADANARARQKIGEARGDARDEKMDADYAVAKEKCDVYAGEAKDHCLTAAKQKYGK